MDKHEMYGRTKPILAMRGIHLDLKGLPPTPKRLLELLDLLAQAHINSVLVEWEDTYPWTTYPQLKSETAYTRKIVQAFLDKAERLSIEIIPLVQCLGHMENVLSRSRFAHLRERSDYVSEICPSHRESQLLVRTLIDDVLDTHQGRIRFFHLGGDEAAFMGSCSKCRRKMTRDGKAVLYMRHMTPLLEHLRDKKITPILWDDMMRNWTPEELRGLVGQADLMIWWYHGRIPSDLEASIQRFSRVGIDLWGASAFKGAGGSFNDTLDLKARTDNTLAWVERARAKGRFRGVMATGWSRYDTFRPPCEGLESSLDALIIAGGAMWDGQLPVNYDKLAVTMLCDSRMRKLAGQRFLDCREAARKLDAWIRDTYTRRLQSWAALASLAGEPDRCNPYREKELREAVRNHLAEGRRLGSAWKRVHRGFVPSVWLERYVVSRLLPVERYAAGNFSLRVADECFPITACKNLRKYLTRDSSMV